jgi:hypothetical protein
MRTNRDTIVLFSSSLRLCETPEAVDLFVGRRSNRQRDREERTEKRLNWGRSRAHQRLINAYVQQPSERGIHPEVLPPPHPRTTRLPMRRACTNHRARAPALPTLHRSATEALDRLRPPPSTSPALRQAGTRPRDAPLSGGDKGLR